MKFITYGKYIGEPADAIDLEELIKRLGDFFLQSGFESQFYGISEMDPREDRWKRSRSDPARAAGRRLAPRRRDERRAARNAAESRRAEQPGSQAT